jgi:3-methyladenine DNA glycosylase AlkD
MKQVDKSYSKVLKEIQKNLRYESLNPSSKDKPKYSLLDPKNIAFRKHYIGTQYDFYGLSLPQETVVYKRGFQSNTAKTFEERLQLWTYVWKNGNHYHVMSQALTGFSELLSEVQTAKQHMLLLKELTLWLPYLDNWAHSDGVSSMLAKLLEASFADKKLLDQHLKLRNKWNKSKNFWERRQSIVSLLYYAERREKWLSHKAMLKYLEPLVDDEAFYVQRGVGWTLRELYNVYPKETYAYMTKNICRLSAIAISAGTEKLSKSDKAKLKKLRAVR